MHSTDAVRSSVRRSSPLAGAVGWVALALLASCGPAALDHDETAEVAGELTESFTTPSTQFHMVSGGVWSFTSGQYRLGSPASAAPLGNLATHTAVLTKAFSVSVRAQVTSGSAWDDVALVLNYQDAKNFYFVSFNEQDDAETNGIFRVLDGTVTELANLSRTVDVGNWHTLKVSRTPDTLTAWVDGVSVGTASDTSHRGGLSGLGSYNNAVSFDDFRLRVTDSTPVDQPPAPTPVLAAPVGLAATAGNAQVSLSWSAVAGASGYRVYRGAVQVAQPATAAFTDTGLVNGQSYSYQVSAVNAASESPKSLQVSAVPVAPVTPPQTGITHGQQINASNTGFAAGGLTVADLVTQEGGTFSTNGQVIERRHFTSSVTLTGANQILRDCFIDVGEDENVMALILEGTGTLVERVKVVARGRGGFIGVMIGYGSGHTLRRVESSNFENTVTTYQNNVTIEESYLHDPASPYAGAHHDVVEIYGGNDVRIARSRMTMGPSETAVVNVAPWGGGSNSVNRVTIEDSFLDGGNMHFIFDNQAGGITMARVLRNRLGGATAYGGYLAYRGPDANDPGIVHTVAAQTSNPSSVLWPATGPDINVWAVEKSLSPDRSGQLVQ